ncbi:MAG: hypothetical protein KJ606_08500 [Chloroflexi bacterium]|nr:hypothetical protein [Chloroflexota bacterium]
MRLFQVFILILALLLSSCTRTAPVKTDSTPVAVAPIAHPDLPTSLPVQTYLPPTRIPGTPISSPTPNGNVTAFPTFTPLPDNAALQSLSTPTPGPQALS